jgi:UDP-N-acetylglucosamine--N-acetylmuramyl-(pentapeptide) pyrophosphoryl-undecaprenol N-acetylglucosamine transferase
MSRVVGKKMVVAAGGTGGHLFPALAVARWWMENGGTVHWLGSVHGLDARVIPEQGISYRALPVSGLRGRGIKGKFRALNRLVKSLFIARSELRRERPDVVLAMGGYASAPGALAASWMRIPVVMHEQNSIAGLTNRGLVRFANKILEGFPQSFPSSRRAIYVGNPVRNEFFNVLPPAERYAARSKRFHVLVLGGSQGARALNRSVPQALGALSDRIALEVRHQSGESAQAEVATQYDAYEMSVKVEPFIDQMAEALAWADLVIGRAGAMTIAELTAVGVASILIPLPSAADDHQNGNAAFLETAGAAIRLQESELSRERLSAWVEELAQDRERGLKMAEAAHALKVTDSVKRIGEICREVAK